MALVADIPHFYCWVRAQFLYNLSDHHEELVPCCVFAVDSIESHAIGFDIMIDCGAQFARLPIHAFRHTEERKCTHDLCDLELWNNFSYSVESHEYGYLRGLLCDAYINKSWAPGQYMFTLSWFGSQYAEQPGAGGFKRAHILKLDCGCYAAQPNNRIRWHEPSFITKPFPKRPDFLTNEYVWNAEARSSPWATEDSDRFFYEDKETE